jgi:hypothetical protein
MSLRGSWLSFAIDQCLPYTIAHPIYLRQNGRRLPNPGCSRHRPGTCTPNRAAAA